MKRLCWKPAQARQKRGQNPRLDWNPKLGQAWRQPGFPILSPKNRPQPVGVSQRQVGLDLLAEPRWPARRDCPGFLGSGNLPQEPQEEPGGWAGRQGCWWGRRALRFGNHQGESQRKLGFDWPGKRPGKSPQAPPGFLQFWVRWAARYLIGWIAVRPTMPGFPFGNPRPLLLRPPDWIQPPHPLAEVAPPNLV